MSFSFFQSGVLGLNARNLLYIKPFNRRKAVAFADDKLKTKAFLSARGIPAAKIYARIENEEQRKQFDFSKLPDECVLKPNYGFGGEGIIVIKGREGDHFLTAGKQKLSQEFLREHMRDILDGIFSVNGRRDTAFFEQILIPHECFAKFRPAGLPDIRVIVFNLVPVMAMVRIPTVQSAGKANVHLGGIGIGIDISQGTTTYAAQYNHTIDELPHGGSPSGIQIPYWDEILLISSQIQQLTNIGFLACDITIDQQMGPALLEVNARAGLMVQLANLAPLRARLERVKGIKVTTPEKGVRIGKDLFGKKQSERSARNDLPDKPILGTHETITISGTGATVEAPCIIAPDLERTIFSTKLIEELQGTGALGPVDTEEGTYKVKFSLGGQKLQTLVGSGSVPGDDRALIGRRDLTNFLIDPSKTQRTGIQTASVKTDLRAVDKLLSQVDQDLRLIKRLKPVNLAQERERAAEDPKYNPLFQYADLEEQLSEAQKRLEQPIKDDSPLGILLEKKRDELRKRITLLRARGDAEAFTKASKVLFGVPTKKLQDAASRILAERLACDLPPPQKEMLSAEQAKDIFQAALERYSLHEWDIVVKATLVADCTVGGHSLYIREGAYFSPIHVEALIAHEIETHILSAENGNHQPCELLRNGTAGYLDTQEGLAVYNQNRIYGPYQERRFNPPRNLLAIAFALEHSFAETREYLMEELGLDADKALTNSLQMKRGLADTSEPGAFTKGVAYFRGLLAIEKFVEKEGDLRRLYIGKVSIDDLDLIEQIPELKAPLLLPEFLREGESLAPRDRRTRTKKKEVDSSGDAGE